MFLRLATGSMTSSSKVTMPEMLRLPDGAMRPASTGYASCAAGGDSAARNLVKTNLHQTAPSSPRWIPARHAR
eukprot:scaffold2850_cov235-Pinguiococcus_pyrenoidosus.AAC.8